MSLVQTDIYNLAFKFDAYANTNICTQVYTETCTHKHTHYILDYSDLNSQSPPGMHVCMHTHTYTHPSFRLSSTSRKAGDKY